MLWCSVAGNSRFQDVDDIHGPDRPRRMHRHTLARIFVEDRQNPEPAAVLGLVFDKVPTLDLPRPLGRGPLRGRGSYPLPLHASLLFAYLDAFLSPDTSHPLRVDLKTLTPQQCRDAPIAVARMLVAEFQHLLADGAGPPRSPLLGDTARIWPDPAYGKQPICSPRRSPCSFGQPAFLQTGLPFFELTSFRMWFCTLRSAMMRLSRAFSSSNARKRRASLTSIPPYLRFHA